MAENENLDDGLAKLLRQERGEELIDSGEEAFARIKANMESPDANFGMVAVTGPAARELLESLTGGTLPPELAAIFDGECTCGGDHTLGEGPPTDG